MHHRFLLILSILLASTGSVPAAESWRVVPLEDGGRPDAIVMETRAPAPEGLPDGRVETHAGPGDIVAAWYTDPTDRYGHAVLGDAIEAGTLVVEAPDGQRHSFALPATEVFEDRTPRLADLDEDGHVEVITIRSSLSLGAAVTVYGLIGGALVQRASTEPIGLAHRWLNIAAVADLRGSGRRDIAFVETPHIGGTLYLYAFDEDGLHRVAQMAGFSNHQIGAREMRLSALADIDGDGHPELALPDAARRSLRIVGFGPDGLVERARILLPARIDKAIAATSSGLATRFIVGLDNETVYEIRR